jgi:hypothetical protein
MSARHQDQVVLADEIAGALNQKCQDFKRARADRNGLAIFEQQLFCRDQLKSTKRNSTVGRNRGWNRHPVALLRRCVALSNYKAEFTRASTRVEPGMRCMVSESGTTDLGFPRRVRCYPERRHLLAPQYPTERARTCLPPSTKTAPTIKCEYELPSSDADCHSKKRSLNCSGIASTFLTASLAPPCEASSIWQGIGS